MSVKQPDGAVTSYTYDQKGNLTTVEDANGNATKYEYDPEGRRTRTTLADGSTSTSRYDRQDLPTETVDYNQIKTTCQYDEQDRIIKEQTGGEYTSYRYDKYGRLAGLRTGDSEITYAYNRYGELEQKTYENGEAVRYLYDKYGRTSEIQVLCRDKVQTSTKYEYDKMNRLTRVTGRNGEATVYTYDANGNRETATFANGVMLTYTYDDLNRLILQKSVDRDGTVIAQYAYTLGKNGERTKATESGACGEAETTYDYDKANRLVKETIRTDDGKTVYEYSYDKAGNRTCKETDGVKTSYTYDSRNRLTAEKTGNSGITYHYDANGNLVKQSGGTDTIYTYDVYNRLTSYRQAEKKESYTYDAEGARRSRTTGTDSIYFVSDTSGSLSQPLAETDGKGNCKAEYTGADSLAAQVRDGKVSYYIHDGHGDVRALVSDDGKITDRYRYSAYGELLEKSGNTENHYLYTGEYYDGTSSLYYLRARYMNPSTGSFLTMDTYEGSIYEPATLHRYLYANGNPVSYSDPGGHFAGLIGSMVTTAISAVMRNIHTLNVMGLISGVTNAAVTGILGGSGEDIGRAFITGYLTGFGLGAVMYVAAAFEIMTIAEFLMIGAAANTVMNIVLMTASVISGDSRSALVYGALSVLSFVSFCQAYNVNGSVTVTGKKGTARIEVEGAGAGDAAVSKGNLNSINSLDDLLANPDKLSGVSGEELYNYLVKNGYEVKPLNKGSFKGISFEEGGGFKVNWGGDRILQFHPENLSHHGGAYIKISSGEIGTIRFDLDGNLIN